MRANVIFKKIIISMININIYLIQRILYIKNNPRLDHILFNNYLTKNNQILNTYSIKSCPLKNFLNNITGHPNPLLFI